MLVVDDWEPPEEADDRAGGPAGSRLLGILGLVVVAAVTFSILTGGGAPTAAPRPAPTSSAATTTAEPEPPVPVGVDSIQRCPVALGGVALSASTRGTAVERWQCAPDQQNRQGAVVRRLDGSLARHGAVVTWPVTIDEAVPTGLEPSADGRRRVFVWPMVGDYARIRGDLSERELIAIARNVQVQQEVLLVGPPEGFTLVYNGRYAPQLVHEIRYAANDIGRETDLGDGLVFSGLQSAAGVEDGLYAEGAVDAGKVRGRPSVLARSWASGAIFWEPGPGQVAYVGYSGKELDDTAIAALKALASTATVLTPAQFVARAR